MSLTDVQIENLILKERLHKLEKNYDDFLDMLHMMQMSFGGNVELNKKISSSPKSQKDPKIFYKFV